MYNKLKNIQSGVYVFIIEYIIFSMMKQKQQLILERFNFTEKSTSFIYTRAN